MLYTDGIARTMPATSVYLCGTGSNGYVVVCDYDLDEGALTEARSLLGSGSELYMSGSDLYVLGSKWETRETAKYPESVYTVTEYLNAAATEIYRFDLRAGGLELAAKGSVPGYIESQFSADQYNGHLRLVTTKNESTYRTYVDAAYDFTNYRWDESSTSSGLYILDAGLNVVGSVTDLAPGEQVYSARFDGDVAYFTTFRNVDPLFAVDVSDPTAPKVLSALKISGFSEYLHSWTEGKLFGFGYEADEDTGRTRGLKLVMFNTEDKTDVRAENSLVLYADYSQALYDHKAFFIDSAKNIIGFAGDGDYYIFSYDAADGFTQLARIDFEGWGYNVRGFWIGGLAYIVGQETLTVLDMGDWSTVATLNIAPEK